MKNKLLEALCKAKTVAVSGHVRSDGDCVGSCMALYHYIKDNYADTKAVVFLEPDVYKRQGLDRPLKKEKDFARSLGKEVELKLYKPVNKQKEFIGCLKEYDKDTVTIELDDEETVTFNRADIAIIRLAFFY